MCWAPTEELAARVADRRHPPQPGRAARALHAGGEVPPAPVWTPNRAAAVMRARARAPLRHALPAQAPRRVRRVRVRANVLEPPRRARVGRVSERDDDASACATAATPTTGRTRRSAWRVRERGADGERAHRRRGRTPPCPSYVNLFFAAAAAAGERDAVVGAGLFSNCLTFLTRSTATFWTRDRAPGRARAPGDTAAVATRRGRGGTADAAAARLRRLRRGRRPTSEFGLFQSLNGVNMLTLLYTNARG